MICESQSQHSIILYNCEVIFAISLSQRKAKMSDVFSLTNPPMAPKKRQALRPTVWRSIRSLQLPLSPPAAPKKEKRTKKVDLTPIPFEWEHETWVKEADLLADSGVVRPKLLRLRPESILEMEDVCYLNELSELYFPASQPWNIIEEAFLSLMRDLIKFRIDELTRSLL